MANPGTSATVLRNLAKDLLTADENEDFKNALQTYKTSRSLTNLVTQLTQTVTSTEKLMLLIELGRILPEHLRRDFHKLCCLHFPRYNTFLTYFNPNTIGERNRVISKDSSGHFQVISTGVDQNIFANIGPTDQRSLQGESGIDVNSDVDDISRHGGEANGGHLESSWKIENRSHSGSVSSQRYADRVTSPPTTPSGSVSSTHQMKAAWKQSQSSLPQDHGGGGIRNRARSLRILSGSLPSVLAATESPSVAKAEDRVRILLKRRKDGTLGVGVRGGKEYNSPIEVYQVEPGSQGHIQGLRVGDRILDVNGTDFTNVTHTEAVMMMRNAWNVIMIVQRHRDEQPVGAGGISYRSNSSFDDLDVLVFPTKKGKLGCGVERDSQNNLVVRKVEKNSPASKAGINKRDRLMEIDGLRVASLTDKQVATMTSVKRVRMKICRPTMSVATHDTADHMDFNDIFSNLALDFSQPGPSDGGDSDCATFASSTPRRAIRSRSEERRPATPNDDVDSKTGKPRSSSQVRSTNYPSDSSNEKKASKSYQQRPLPAPPVQQQTPPNPVHHRAQVDQPKASSNHILTKSVRSKMKGYLAKSEISDSIDDNYILSTQPAQQRMYKPRLMNGSKYSSSSSSYSPSIQYKSNLSKQPRHLGRYISKTDQQALPTRMTMVYTTKKFKAEAENERSRSRKRGSSSASRKMKDIRNKSQSPHGSISGSGTQDKRSGSVPTRGNREFLRAIQNSVERRQRAQRLSLYQLPDYDDDAWVIG